MYGLFNFKYGLLTDKYGLFTVTHGLLTGIYALFTLMYGLLSGIYGLFVKPEVKVADYLLAKSFEVIIA